ncbi:MAG: hypothetical protein B6D40_03650 [Anaerolineae bacterium UTCFX3]|nr:MAG: hypothetical protein B6D40_03650 [Anaerolineae bacterium UTCFX3]
MMNEVSRLLKGKRIGVMVRLYALPVCFTNSASTGLKPLALEEGAHVVHVLHRLAVQSHQLVGPGRAHVAGRPARVVNLRDDVIRFEERADERFARPLDGPDRRQDESRRRDADHGQRREMAQPRKTRSGKHAPIIRQSERKPVYFEKTGFSRL